MEEEVDKEDYDPMCSNLYSRLKVDKSSSEKEITASYRKLALKYHPDRNMDDHKSSEAFKSLSAAYQVLSDPNRRRVYDLGGEDPLRDDFDTAAYQTINISEQGAAARIFGSMLTKMGVPIPTAIG